MLTMDENISDRTLEFLKGCMPREARDFKTGDFGVSKVKRINRDGGMDEDMGWGCCYLL